MAERPADHSTDDEGGISRREALAGGGLLALGAGVGGYWLLGSGGGSGSDLPFSVWEEMQAGLRASPDHLPGTADRLVEESDPEAIYEFVRDEIATQPPRVKRAGSDKFPYNVNGGPRAALRSGMGTPREKAEVLASLLDRAGYESEVVRYDRRMRSDRLRKLYFGAVSHEFDPAFDSDQLAKWRERLGVEDDEDDGDEPTVLDRNGEASSSLAERISSALPDAAGTENLREFEYRAASAVPAVRFRSPDAAPGGGTTTSAETGTPTTGETGTTDPGSEWRYAELFYDDESFGTLNEPDLVNAPIDSPSAERVRVTLEAATTDAPTERMELVSGTWDATEVAGRQLFVDTLPGVSQFDYPNVRFTDVNRFVPSMTVQDPHADEETLASLSVQGNPFNATGDRYTVDYEGTLRRGETVVREGPEEETTLVVETPDGDRRTVTPVESDRSVEEYYSYSNEESLDSHTPDGLEREDATVTFLYRNTATGDLSLVVIHDNPPPDDDGGQVRLEFDGVRGYEWLVGDEPRRDSYDTPDGAFLDSETATWGWANGHTDGGALGTLRSQFDVEVTHYGQWSDGSEKRQGIDRWVFVDGGNLDDPIELASFGDENADASMRVFTDSDREGETTPDGTTTPASPDRASTVADLAVTASAETYPQVSLEVEALDADGRPIEGLPGTAFEVAQGERRVAAELRSAGTPYAFSYRSPTEGAVGDERTVSVVVPGADVEGSATYTVPAEATDPRAERGICGLYLRVQVGEHTSRRTLAGWDPDLDGDRDPTEADRNEAISALFGNHVLAFESAGVTPTVYLEERLAGRLTLKPVLEARESGTHEDVTAAVREGLGSVEEFPQHFHPTLPDRVTEDTITYGTGLRTVLFGRRPEFGTDEVELSVDILSTSTIRTVTRDRDPGREFRTTMDRTARRAVVERENLERSTASLLAAATLVPAGEVGDGWGDEVEHQFQVARNRRATSNDYQVVDRAGDTAAFWNVEERTGAVTGVLPDGSGGGDRVEEIKETLGEIQQLSYAMGLMIPGSIGFGIGGAALGAVAAYYGRLLAKLYAVASIAIATMDASQLQEQARRAIATFACNLVVNMGLSWAGGSIVNTILTVNNVSGAMGTGVIGCGDF